MKQLSELVVGDMVVIETFNRQKPFISAAITRVTATLLIVGRNRFNRKTGVIIGSNLPSLSPRICTNVTTEQAEQANVNAAVKNESAKLAKQIHDIGYVGLRNYPLETLQQVAKLLNLMEAK